MGVVLGLIDIEVLPLAPYDFVALSVSAERVAVGVAGALAVREGGRKNGFGQTHSIIMLPFPP